MTIKSLLTRFAGLRVEQPTERNIVAVPLGQISFQEMAKAFEELYETRLTPSNSLVLRGKYRGSFQTCRRQVEQFVRQYLDSNGRSDAFTRDLVEDFRFYLVAGSDVLAPDQLHTNHNKD